MRRARANPTLSLREALLGFSRPVLVRATDEAALDANRAAPAGVVARGLTGSPYAALARSAS